MFGWFSRKKPETSPRAEPPAPPAVSPPVAITPPPREASGEDMPAVALPVPPPSDGAPAVPPSSDDWASLIESSEDMPKVMVPSPAPASSPSARESGKVATPRESGKQVPPAPPPSADSNDLLSPGAKLRAIPEKQPATPRGWNVVVLKTDNEGIWIARIPGEDDPLPVAAKEVLSLVYFDERKQTSFDCPIIKVKAGNPEQVLVGRPLKLQQEKSKLDSIGSRQHFRIETQLPVEVKIPGMAGKGIPPISGHTRDISRGGLALLLPRSFEGGRELEIRVLSWNFPLQIKARVVRCDEEHNGRHVVAVAFPEDLSPITRDLINHFIMENQRGRI